MPRPHQLSFHLNVKFSLIPVDSIQDGIDNWWGLWYTPAYQREPDNIKDGIQNDSWVCSPNTRSNPSGGRDGYLRAG